MSRRHCRLVTYTLNSSGMNRAMALMARDHRTYCAQCTSEGKLVTDGQGSTGALVRAAAQRLVDVRIDEIVERAVRQTMGDEPVYTEGPGSEASSVRPRRQYRDH